MSRGTYLAYFQDGRHMHYQNANCHNSVTSQLIFMFLVAKVWFSVMLNPFQGLKNNQIIQKRAPKTRWPPISTKNHAQYFIKWYAILKPALSLLKQTVVIKMYVFITSKHVNNENLCIYGFTEAIFKMSAMENDKKATFGFSIIQLLFVKNL